MLFFVGPGGGIEWLVLLLGIFGVARVVQRSSRPRSLQPSRVARPPMPRPTVPRLKQIDTRKLPASVRLKVGQIQRKAQELLRYASQFPVGSEDLYLVQATVNDYVPATLHAYMAMPPGSDRVAVTADGKTPWQVLWEQLSVIERKLDEITWGLHRRNGERMVANGRFLEERFKQGDKDLRP
jgi:hypothetical protein